MTIYSLYNLLSSNFHLEISATQRQESLRRTIEISTFEFLSIWMRFQTIQIWAQRHWHKLDSTIGSQLLVLYLREYNTSFLLSVSPMNKIESVQVIPRTLLLSVVALCLNISYSLQHCKKWGGKSMLHFIYFCIILLSHFSPNFLAYPRPSLYPQLQNKQATATEPRWAMALERSEFLVPQ